MRLRTPPSTRRASKRVSIHRIGSGRPGLTVAQNSTFANYSAVNSSIVAITFQKTGNQLTLTWPTGTLQSAPQVNGPYTDVAGATSPYPINTTGGQQFYRVRVP